MDASLYHPTFISIIATLCTVMVCRYISSPNYALQEQQQSLIAPLLISIVLIFWLGNRPLSGAYFGDTSNYALSYKFFNGNSMTIDWSKEWVWQALMVICKKLSLDVSAFLTVIEAGYVLAVFFAVVKFLPNNPLIGMLFVWSSLMYFSFGVNGLRNGLACHILLLALSFILDSKYIIGTLLCLISFGIHKSTMLPIAAIATGFFFKDKVKYAIYIWVLSIPISLVAGSAATAFFASLGFDDRMSSYTDNSVDMFSSSGFRWDFLLYSSFPVLMIWYICIKRKVSDSWYNVISIVYCLCNAFWVLVIRAEYSNRFAYLSWFIYPIVIAYPLVNLPVWEDQDRKTGLILLAYCGFTVMMNTLYW